MEFEGVAALGEDVAFGAAAAAFEHGHVGVVVAVGAAQHLRGFVPFGVALRAAEAGKLAAEWRFGRYAAFGGGCFLF